ncbi:MAG: helix-turn-helix domain-containing protein [Chloroflexales bacterium]|nr:helix-turn-helix domain-containing protein [Chloroflexales bacterium]
MALAQRLKQLRLARGMSLDALAATLGGAVTKQALSKYELGKAAPSPRVLALLAVALGVKAAQLVAPPDLQVEFLGYRRRASLPKREQERVESHISDALERRVQLQDRLQLDAALDLDVRGIAVARVEDAERAAAQVRARWGLGLEPLASVTATLEDHFVHVLEIDGDRRFDGISAVVRTSDGQVAAAAVVSDEKVAGERQRLNLAHELGHLTMEVSALPEDQEETAAFRFGAALLAPAEVIRQEVGATRSSISAHELLLLKQRFGMSVQALLRRLRDLEIITASYYKQWCIDINRLGWRREEPGQLPREEPTWLRRHVLRALAEELLSPAEAAALAPGLAETTPSLDHIQRRAFLALPLTERRRIIAEQAAQLAPDYAPDPDWQDTDDAIIDTSDE